MDVVVTEILNALLRGMGSDWAFSQGFIAMLSVKVLLVVVMAGLQVWRGIAWKCLGGPVEVAVPRAPAGTTVQLILGAVPVLLGLGVRSV